MKTWDDWSDFDLSFKVASLIKLRLCNGQHYKPKVSFWNDDGYCTMFNINNPADIWPIISENGICLISPTKGRKSSLWSASWNEDGGKWSSGDIIFGDKNPLRAAAIVFLMMNGVNPE